MHEVTFDCIAVHIEAPQKSFGDKPKCVNIFQQTSHEVSTGKPYFLNNSANTHSVGVYYHVIFSGSRIMIKLFLL